MRRYGIALALILVAAVPTAYGSIVFYNLGTAAPPTLLNGFAPVTPLDTTPQTAITDGTSTASFAATPFSGTIAFSPNLTKQTVGIGWATWSNGFTGPVFVNTTSTATITLPAGATAFYAYIEPEAFGNFNVTAVTDSGTTSGPISVQGDAGADGFAFYTTETGESISTITVTADPGANGFAVGEFGMSETANQLIPTLTWVGLAVLASLLALGGIIFLRRR